MDFMRGKFPIYQKNYIMNMLTQMTVDEKKRLRTRIKEGSIKEKINILNGGVVTSTDRYDLESLLDESDLFETWTEPEWGFPKGRRIRCETDLECAIREFNEETNVPRDAYTILKDIRLEETFVGLNGIRYRHVYFVALLTAPDQVNVHQKMTYMQRREISAIGWKTFPECRGYVRPHHVERETMIEVLENIVKTYESTP
jgi:8-oxo-dGTP pyrophosphatase MutT (NUDIX family)